VSPHHRHQRRQHLSRTIAFIQITHHRAREEHAGVGADRCAIRQPIIAQAVLASAQPAEPTTKSTSPMATGSRRPRVPIAAALG
jgi:hypothetical protein